MTSAVDGIEVGTESAWRKCAALGLPRMIFVTREDKHRADFHAVLARLRSVFGHGCAPLELPLGEEEAFHGVADVLTEEALEYDPDGRHRKEPLPGDIADEEHRLHDELIEEIVSGDDEQLEKYLTGEIPTIAELERTLAHEVLDCTEFPVLVGSGHTGVGVDRLADFICELGPSPADRPSKVDRRWQRDRGQRRSDRRATRLRLQDGRRPVRRPDLAVQGPVRHDPQRRPPRRGGERTPSSGCTACSTSAAASTSMPAASSPATSVACRSSSRPRPAARSRRRASRCGCNASSRPAAGYGVALKPVTQSDDDKLSGALQRLVVEDPALVVGFHDETHQTVLRGVGDIHVAVALARLERKFGVHVATEEVRVAYRETILASGQAEGKVKKQSGGHGQYAVALPPRRAARAR